MRVSALFAVGSVVTSAAADLIGTIDLQAALNGVDLSDTNFYGSPQPPWIHGANPGWYYGNSPHLFPDIPCLVGFLCKILEYFPHVIHCPPPPKPQPTPSPTPTPTPTPSPTGTPPPPADGYVQTFSNLTGATQASDFLTFGLVDTVDNCKAMCNSVAGCTFINSYHDVNGKGGSTQLTCSLFSNCHNSSDADNRGGQTQPDGSVDFIINSDGFCKGALPS